jgi:molecular chaperone GrpE
MSEENTQTAPVEEVQSPEDRIQDLTQKNEELMNNWKRAAADFENYRKRKESEGKDLLEFAKEVTVSRLLPSLQSLEQVLTFAPVDEKYKDWLTGLRATILQLEKAMEELGVTKIKTVGEKFDPIHHEAVEEVTGEPGTVIREIQPGFMLNGRVVIAARVAVGK